MCDSRTRTRVSHVCAAVRGRLYYDAPAVPWRDEAAEPTTRDEIDIPSCAQYDHGLGCPLSQFQANGRLLAAPRILARPPAHSPNHPPPRTSS